MLMSLRLEVARIDATQRAGGRYAAIAFDPKQDTLMSFI